MGMENAAIVVSSRTTEAGGVIGLVGWASSVDWMGWIGIALALGGFLANLYYQRRRDRRERLEHEARMTAIREQQCKL